MISVLCVNYRSADDVAGLADSLAAESADGSLELIVVNHSPDEPVHLPPAAAAIGRVVDRPNAGFAAGVNAAFVLSRGDLLFVANPDVRVEPNALRTARDFFDQNPDAAVLLPLLRYPDGRVQPSVRRFYTWPAALYARTPLRRLGLRPRFFRRYLYEDLDRSRPADVDWGLGGAMFIRRSDCEDGRVFDPRFFLYFEDVDLCMRLWRRGRRVVFCPQVQCIHAHRRGSAQPFGRHGWHHLVSFVRFIRKHGGLPPRPQRKTVNVNRA
jgi:N-acetylglucosaminyl-diphospho-decaprenol L-rhamnosyltransferase